MAAESGRLVATLHLSPHHVASTPRYRAWMQQLPGIQVWGGKPGGGSPPHAAAAVAGAPAISSPSAVVPSVAAVLAAPGSVSKPLLLPGIMDTGASGAPAAIPDVQPLAEVEAPLHEASAALAASPGAPAGPATLLAAGGLSTLSAYEMRERNSMGFRASARTSCKLSMVSTTLFPLPFVLRPRLRIAVASKKRREPGCCPSLAPTSTAAGDAGSIDIHCSGGEGALDKGITAAATANTDPQRNEGHPHPQQLELGVKAAKVIEAGLLWRLHLELPSRHAAHPSGPSPGQPLMDMSLAPECVDPQAVQGDVAEAKGGDLEEMIKVGSSQSRRLKRWSATSRMILSYLHISGAS